MLSQGFFQAKSLGEGEIETYENRRGMAVNPEQLQCLFSRLITQEIN